MRRFINVPLVPFVIICVVAASAVATGGYLLYRLLFPAPQETEEELLSPLVEQCLTVFRRYDNYALLYANRARIIAWCDSGYIPNTAKAAPEMNKAETDKMHMCIGKYIEEHAPPEPHRTIEDVFDSMNTDESAKDFCYHEAWRAKNSKSDK